eukprot:CAMPEP_0180005756 /NCGR_PEP_ID=MMETSP0984-20121128/12886_1 /TAXON_ID=483367 /ORGANISM="non described non described, Strain CCMP 2436" /LENGTH=89 /DNA_ID=CAMNT_0021926531 /DNA_START=51 /DNA_END=320 /DNA_ORIENTATION=+
MVFAASEGVSEAHGRPFLTPPLPSTQALESAKQRLLDFQTSLQQLGAPGMCEEVQQAVHRRFREWLVKSGNMRQVQDLMALEAGRLPGQ